MPNDEWPQQQEAKRHVCGTAWPRWSASRAPAAALQQQSPPLHTACGHSCECAGQPARRPWAQAARGVASSLSFCDSHVLWRQGTRGEARGESSSPTTGPQPDAIVALARQRVCRSSWEREVRRLHRRKVTGRAALFAARAPARATFPRSAHVSRHVKRKGASASLFTTLRGAPQSTHTKSHQHLPGRDPEPDVLLALMPSSSGPSTPGCAVLPQAATEQGTQRKRRVVPCPSKARERRRGVTPHRRAPRAGSQQLT